MIIRENEAPRFAVVTDWNDGLARVQPHSREDRAREEASTEALKGNETMVVQILEHTPGVCTTIKEADQTQG